MKKKSYEQLHKDYITIHRKWQELLEENIRLQTILDNQPSECEHLDECTEYAIENHEPERDPNG